MSSDQIIVILDLAAVIACAIAGALAAREEQMDLFGVVVVASVTAVGGGTIRDVLLGSLPVFWVTRDFYIAACILSGILTFAVAARIPIRPKALLIPDALGLGLFTVLGAAKAADLGLGWLSASLMGVVTGVFGGVLRDVLCNRVPMVFKSELYATTSWLGAMAFLLSRQAGHSPGTAMGTGALVVVALRLIAVRWGIRLPAAGNLATHTSKERT